jgi:preprotein translocase subunit SecA
MSTLAPLPMPGLVWGRYPQRTETRAPAAPQRAGRIDIAAARLRQAAWAALDDAGHAVALHALRARLAHAGWAGELQADALGCAAAACHATLGRNPFDTQLQAASVLLGDQFAEMQTGEGKTCVAALTAAVAALAGVPVHVLTANDYLAARDAELARPLFARLGLRVGTVVGGSTPGQRRAAYACDITYATAREVAFDYLRDSLAAVQPGDELRQRARDIAAAPAAAPLLRGLCMAVLDEADSLLIDEASVPLVLAETADDAAQRAACFQALGVARQLEPGRDFTLADGHAIAWLAAGTERADALCAKLGGAWLNRRHRHDLLTSALVALHALHRDRHYLVRDGRIELLDAQTGRVGAGRVWSNGLQTLVELKEGCKPGPTTATRAQITFQRFFARYLRLCGMSGTLAECRRELRAVCGRRVALVAPRQPSRRVLGEERLYADAASRRRAAVARIAELHRAGRPVLVGTDTVAESEALSAMLAAAGIPHQVLNARHDAAEAAIVTRAGEHGAVTVATQMAGRGTDITLGDGVAALGGLHVLCCLDSLNPRLARQLVGRCARQGDPGSAETWRTLPAGAGLSRTLLRGRHGDEAGRIQLPAVLLRHRAAWLGRQEERRAARQRRRLLEQDREWQSRLNFQTSSR